MSCVGFVPSIVFIDYLNNIVSKTTFDTPSLFRRGEERDYRENIQDQLASIVIGYGMMNEVTREACRTRAGSDFALDTAIRGLQCIMHQCESVDWDKYDFLMARKKQMLYWTLLLKVDVIQDQELIKFVGGFFKGVNKQSTSGTEWKVYRSFEHHWIYRNTKFMDKFKVEFKDSVRLKEEFETRLGTELDFVITQKDFHKPHEPLFLEIDGPFHFVRNLDAGAQATASPLNGQTLLKTSLLLRYGKVARMSTLCDTDSFNERVRNMPLIVSRLFESIYNKFDLVDPENYPAFYQRIIRPIKIAKKALTAPSGKPSVAIEVADDTDGWTTFTEKQKKVKSKAPGPFH
jgi:hypothetical protein